MYKIAHFIISFLLLELLYTGCTHSQLKKNDDDNNNNDFINYCENNYRVIPNEIARKIDSIILQGVNNTYKNKLLILKAKCKFTNSEYDSTNIILDNVLLCTDYEKSIYDKNKLLSEIYNTKGNIYSRKMMSDSSILYYKKAYKYSSLLGLSTNMVDIAINLADANIKNGRFDMGAYWYRKSLSISDTLNLPEKQRFPSYYGLGQVYMELRDFDQCDFYYNKASAYYDSMLPFEKHFYLNNRGNTYYYRGDYKTALKYFRESQALANSREGMEFERNLTMVNLGDIFIQLNQTDSAEYYLNKCYNYFQKLNNTSALYYIETQLIELAIKKGNTEEAKKIISQAIKLSYVEPNMLLIRNKYLQHYFEKSGDYQNAYYYQKKNTALDDSIRNAKIKMRTSEISLRYKQDSTLMKKELSIIEKEKEVILLNQWIYILILGILLIIAICITYIIYKKRVNDKRLLSLETDINCMRIESIRNRISPHFIFNILNREMIGNSKENLMALSKLIRKNLELTENQDIQLKDELEFVDIYLSIEKENIGNEFYYNLILDKTIDINTMRIPSMFIQIPVENAIKHSLKTKEGKKLITVNIEKVNDYIKIRITDNGGGFKPISTNQGTKTGLKVITQSIYLLNLYNKKPITMRISNVNLENYETGCEIEYNIPINFNYKIRK